MAKSKPLESSKPDKLTKVILHSGIPLQEDTISLLQSQGLSYYGEHEGKQYNEHGKVIVRPSDGVFRKEISNTGDHPLQLWLNIECKYNFDATWYFWENRTIKPPFHLAVCRPKESTSNADHAVENLRESFAQSFSDGRIPISGIDVIKSSICCSGTCVLNPRNLKDGKFDDEGYKGQKNTISGALKQLRNNSNSFYKWLIELYNDKREDHKSGGAIIAPILVTNCKIEVVHSDMQSLEKKRFSKDSSPLESQPKDFVLMYFQGEDDVRSEVDVNWQNGIRGHENFPFSKADGGDLSFYPNYCWVVSVDKLPKLLKYLEYWIIHHYKHFIEAQHD